MTASIIGGTFQTNIMSFTGAPSVGATEVGTCLVPNTSAAPITVNSASFTGASVFSILFGQLPVTIPPGSCMLVQIVCTTSAVGGTKSGLVSWNTSAGALPPVNLFSTNGGSKLDVFPSLAWPAVKVGQSLPFANFIIVNPNLTSATATALAMTTGTDFAISGGPALPLVIGPQSASAPFSVVFTPTTTGLRTDSVVVTDSTGANPTPVTGLGSTLQSFNNLIGPTPAGALLMAFLSQPTSILFTQQNNAPAQLVNTDCEEAASGIKITDFGRPNNENEVLRVRLHYVDLGPATLFITLQTRRMDVTPAQNGTQTQTKTVNIGTAASDEWPRQVTVDFNVTGELVQILIGRNAANGPVMIIDYAWEWVPKGEVLEGV